MKPLYLTSVWPLLAYRGLILVWGASELWTGITHFSRRGDQSHERFSGVALVAATLLALLLGASLARNVPQAAIEDGAAIIVFWSGIALGVAGIVLRQYAIRTLGRFFRMRVTTVADQTVVENGPYRWVRHPSYAGGLMTVLGLLVCSTNWLALACFVLAWPGFAYRIRVEEGALLAALGDPYRDYMRRTKRLIPLLL